MEHVELYETFEIRDPRTARDQPVLVRGSLFEMEKQILPVLCSQFVIELSLKLERLIDSTFSSFGKFCFEMSFCYKSNEFLQKIIEP